ncbi:MAG: chorismate mutase [Blastomonas sp.]
MSSTIKPPTDCETMADVRAGVDALDARLIEMLALRFGYMEAAARIKPEFGMVRDEERKAEVIANARTAALEKGIPVGLVTDFWDRLVEASIAFEQERWRLLREDGES